MSAASANTADRISVLLHPSVSINGHYVLVDRGTTWEQLARDAFDYPKNKVTFNVVKPTLVGKQSTTQPVFFNIPLDTEIVQMDQPIQYVLSKARSGKDKDVIIEEDDGESDAGGAKKKGGKRARVEEDDE